MHHVTFFPYVVDKGKARRWSVPESVWPGRLFCALEA